MIRASKRHFIQIIDKTKSAQMKLSSERTERFEVRIEEAVGLRKVLDLIIVNHCVVVGHNIFQDLVFVYSQFLGRLPKTAEGFSHVISETFPTYNPPCRPFLALALAIVTNVDSRVYDTKYISATHPSCQSMQILEYLSMSPLPPTSLETLALWTRLPTADPSLQLCIPVTEEYLR